MNWSTDLAPGAGFSITTKSRKLLRQGRVKPGHECVTGNSPAALLVSHRVFSFSSTELQLSSQAKHKMTCLKILSKAYWSALEKWRHDWTTELEIQILNNSKHREHAHQSLTCLQLGQLRIATEENTSLIFSTGIVACLLNLQGYLLLQQFLLLFQHFQSLQAQSPISTLVSSNVPIVMIQNFKLVGYPVLQALKTGCTYSCTNKLRFFRCIFSSLFTSKYVYQKVF